MSISRLLTLFLLACVCACRSGDADKPPILTEPPAVRQTPSVSPEVERWFRTTSAAAGVRIVPGDQISIVVQEHDELRLSLDVPPNGDIRVYRENKSVTVVNALGKTPQELEAAVTAVHAADLVNPYVQVRIDAPAPRQIYVLGAVTTQGVYAASGNGRLTVVQALALAGGTLETGDLSGVTIQRIYPPTGETVSSPPLDIRRVIEDHDQRDNLVVEPGDTIVVPGRQDATVDVMGHVKKPGTYPWRKGMTLSEAIAAAGSFEKFAKTSRIQVVRNGRESLLVDYDAVLEGKTPDLVLQSRDVIFVAERWM